MARRECTLMTERFLGELHQRIQELLLRDHAPTGDLEWLELRCNDTFAMSGELRSASIAQLKKDADNFDEQHPGLLGEITGWKPAAKK